MPSSRTPVTSPDHAPSGTPSTRNGTVEQNSGNTTLSSRLRGCPAYERLSQEERIDVSPPADQLVFFPLTNVLKNLVLLEYIATGSGVSTSLVEKWGAYGRATLVR